jgi:hypothetical protein
MKKFWFFILPYLWSLPVHARDYGRGYDVEKLHPISLESALVLLGVSLITLLLGFYVKRFHEDKYDEEEKKHILYIGRFLTIIGWLCMLSFISGVWFYFTIIFIILLLIGYCVSLVYSYKNKEKISIGSYLETVWVIVKYWIYGYIKSLFSRKLEDKLYRLINLIKLYSKDCEVESSEYVLRVLVYRYNKMWPNYKEPYMKWEIRRHYPDDDININLESLSHEFSVYCYRDCSIKDSQLYMYNCMIKEFNEKKEEYLKKKGEE